MRRFERITFVQETGLAIIVFKKKRFNWFGKEVEVKFVGKLNKWFSIPKMKKVEDEVLNEQLFSIYAKEFQKRGTKS